MSRPIITFDEFVRRLNNSGGLAFPTHASYNGHNISELGMSARDVFASFAMLGFISGEKTIDCKSVAEGAFEMADAMLEERLKQWEKK